jgi:hypothetical protein
MKINQSKFQSENFKIQLGSLINEFKIDKGFLSSLYYPLFLLRRLGYVLVQVFFNRYPVVQVGVNSGFSILVLIFLFYFRPFKDNTSFIAIVSSELCVNLVFFWSGYFVLFDDEKGVKIVESMCIYTIFASICVQILISFYNFGKQVKAFYLKLEKSRSLQFVRRAEEINSAQKIEVEDIS